MHRMTTLALPALLVAAALAAAPVAAQETPDMPDGWLMRFDRANATPDMVNFRVMSPGWHATTAGAGAGIFWQPDMTAEGEYRAHTQIHLMKPAEHPEAFGLFVGGHDLEDEDQTYLYFLVRQDGRYLIKRRHGDETENVVEWTAHDAVPTASADQSTEYTLSVDVGAEEVAFGVNGTTVHTMPAADLQTDGVVGLRINHRLDVHIEELAVEGS